MGKGKNSKSINRIIFIIILLFLLPAAVLAYSYIKSLDEENKKMSQLDDNKSFYYPDQEIAYPSPSQKPNKTANQNYQKQPENNSNSLNVNDPWGVAKQIDDVTWTMKIGYDDRMGTPREIFEALNVYRNRYGIHSLQWDDKLTAYAQSRADYFASIKNTDKHAGINEFLNNPDNFGVLGSTNIGENSSYGFRLSGVHLIEWVYAGDEGHNKNQLDSKWNKVGVGVNETATDLIFGS